MSLEAFRPVGGVLASFRTGASVGAGSRALLVSDEGRQGADELQAILEADGWVVTRRLLDQGEMYEDIDVIILMAGSTADAGKYLHPPVGVVTVDSWRVVGMASSIGFESTEHVLSVVDSSHPLAAGLTGTYAPYLSASFLTWATAPSAEPEVTVVTRQGQATQRIVVAWEAGSALPFRYATTRHVGLGYHGAGMVAGLTSEARGQLLASVRWARDSVFVPLPVPAAPTGVSATAGDNQVTVAWSAVTAAEGYAVRRATATGGPYSTLTSSVTATSFTDSTAVNGTTYFYVVLAWNSSGEGPLSAEVSATPQEAAAPDLVATFASSDEIAMWQSRISNGPFRVRGDFSTNSPPEWSEMQAAMGADFSAGRWDGPTILTSSGAVAHLNNGGGQNNDPPESVRVTANDMMSAAYAAITTGNGSVAQAIRAEIEWQATRSNLDFGNRTLYPYDYYNDLNPLFRMAAWIQDYILAYDITRAMGYPSATIEGWFFDLGDLLENSLHNGLNGIWPNRKSNVWTVSTSHWSHEFYTGARLSNGSTVTYRRGMWVYNNRRNQMAGPMGLIGVLLDNQFFKDEFNRFAKEFLMFGHRKTASDGFWGDVNRPSTSNPQLGISYGFRGLNAMVFGMDAMARLGDNTAYEYSSSHGYVTDSNAVGTNQFKTMEDVLDGYIKWIAGTWPAHYVPGSCSSCVGNSSYLIRSRSTNTNQELCHESALMLAANYYNRSDWQNVLLRVGTPSGFTTNPHTVGGLGGWRSGFRQRGLRDISTNPYPS